MNLFFDGQAIFLISGKAACKKGNKTNNKPIKEIASKNQAKIIPLFPVPKIGNDASIFNVLLIIIIDNAAEAIAKNQVISFPTYTQ